MMIENRSPRWNSGKEGIKSLYSHLSQRAELSVAFIVEKIKPVRLTIGELFTPDSIKENNSNVVELFPEEEHKKLRPQDPRPPHVRILSPEETEEYERRKSLTIYDQASDQTPLDDEVQ